MAETITADLGPALRAIREVLDDNAGANRKIDRDRFSPGVWQTLGTSEASRRAAIMPRFEVSVEGITPHPARPAAPCNIQLFQVTFDVRVVRHMDQLHAASDSTRESLRALAANDKMLVSLALEWSGNLTSDSAGNATNLCSRCLTHTGSNLTRFELNTDSASVIETQHTFTGVYQASITTS